MDHQLSITCVGTGHVATHLLTAFVRAGARVRQVIGRRDEPTKILAEKVNASSHTVRLDDMDNQSDLYILAVKDDDMETVLSNLPFCFTGPQILVHTSGTFDEKKLQNYSQQYGCLYPLQTFRKDISLDLSETPFLINGNTNHTVDQILQWAALLSNNTCFLNYEDRHKIHVAAVFANNFTNHLLTLADHYCELNKLDFSLLWPLVEEGIRKAKISKPENVQTGPAIRGDAKTLHHHHMLLEKHPFLLNIYKTMTVSIQNWYKTR